MSFKLSFTESFYLILLISLGISTRTIFHIAPNVEFVTAITLSSAYFLKDKKLFWLAPFLTMLATDLLIGNSLIFLFTWSAFFIMPISLLLLNFKLTSKILGRLSNVPKLLSVSIFSGSFSTLMFFIWTNFGVVLTTEMYSKSIDGLMQSYVNALPFLKNQFYGNIIIVPVVFLVSFIFFELSIKPSTEIKLNHE